MWSVADFHAARWTHERFSRPGSVDHRAQGQAASAGNCCCWPLKVRIAVVDLRPEGLAELSRRNPHTGKPVATATADVTDLTALRAAVAELGRQAWPDGPADRLCRHRQEDGCISPGGVRRDQRPHPGQPGGYGQQHRLRPQGDAAAAPGAPGWAVKPGVISRAAVYVAATAARKAGVNALFDALRVELRDAGIAVTTVCPGWVRTPMTDPLRLPRHELMDVDRAAGVILEAIRRRAPFVAFPPRQVWQVRLLRYLPRPIGDWLAYKQIAWARRLLPEG